GSRELVSLSITAETRPLPSDLSDLESPARELCNRAGATNLFFQPWMIALAADAFAGVDPRLKKDSASLLTVWRKDSESRRELLALLPVYRKSGGWLRPARLESLRYYFCSLCTPLLDRVNAGATTNALLDELANIHGRRATLSLPLVDSDSTIALELRSAAAAGRFRLFEEQRIERGYAHLGERFNAWDGVSRRRRHDLQRRERRLTEQGNVAVSHCADAGDALEYADHFLALEAAGWKGSAGTALTHHSVNSLYFRRLCHEAAVRGALRATKITLDDRPVAIIISLVSPPQSYAVRMAYDENYAPHSPGHLLVRRHLEWLAGQPDISGSDSCADPNSQMANATWRDRKSLSNFVVSLGTD
ncbi:MAG: GNAT family N-acetyltransferase, partial [Pseudomonadota bacterium]|nr:GNAT family N-acetyltransferase [Pseudomonadota bacterium]